MALTLALLAAAVALLAAVLALALRRVHDLRAELEGARQLADLDPLTSLENRRVFHHALAREVARAHRHERALTLLLLDLDDFKEVNDRAGHLAGDAALAAAAKCIRQVVRSSDVPCRVGGDELAVILPEAGAADAGRIFERLQRGLADVDVAPAGALSASAGVAELAAGDEPDALFRRADRALYEAKGGGKGRISVAARR